MSEILSGHSFKLGTKKQQLFGIFYLHVDANPRRATDLGLRMGSHCAYVGPDRGICFKQNLSDLKSSSLKLNYKFNLLCTS